jgi:hypothetical protein
LNKERSFSVAAYIAETKGMMSPKNSRMHKGPMADPLMVKGGGVSFVLFASVVRSASGGWQAAWGSINAIHLPFPEE